MFCALLPLKSVSLHLGPLVPNAGEGMDMGQNYAALDIHGPEMPVQSLSAGGDEIVKGINCTPFFIFFLFAFQWVFIFYK